MSRFAVPSPAPGIRRHSGFRWLRRGALIAIFAAAPGIAALPSYLSPDLVFILADDLGHADLGCYGQKLIRTPRLDRMAAEGMRFTQHYSGSASCAPARFSSYPTARQEMSPIAPRA